MLSVISRCVGDLPVEDAICSVATAAHSSCLSNMRTQLLHLTVGQPQAQIMQDFAHVVYLDVSSPCTKSTEINLADTCRRLQNAINVAEKHAEHARQYSACLLIKWNKRNTLLMLFMTLVYSSKHTAHMYTAWQQEAHSNTDLSCQSI